MPNTSGQYIVAGPTKTCRIDTDLDGAEGTLVNLDGTDDGVVNAAANATAGPLLVLVEGADGSSTETVGTVALPGAVVKVSAGGAITAGDRVTSNASAVGIATTTANDHYAGIAWENAASGDDFLMVVAPGMVAAS